MTTLKELLLSEMQEFDALLQAMIEVRTKMYNKIATMSDGEKPEELGIQLTFYENGHVISWGDDSERFSPQTFRLLWMLWFAPNRTLSKAGICKRVLEDEDAEEGAIWMCLKRARSELKSLGFPYEIETLRGKGYRLTKMLGT
jgi:DNA-binding response OmpR family regulator